MDTFEGAPDARQAGHIAPSRFRPRYRALELAELALHDAIKAKAAELEALFEQARDMHFGPLAALQLPDPAEPMELQVGFFDPASRYFDDGMTSLELAVMWTVKGLTTTKPSS